MKPRLFTLLLVVVSLCFETPVNAQFTEVIRKLTRSTPEEPTKQIAYFRLKGALTETPTEMPPLFGSEAPLSLKVLLERFQEARQDDDVVAVVVDLHQAALGLAQLQEIHRSLRQFAAVDKQVFIHSDILRTATYACATGASHISMVPTGILWLTGLYGETPYLRGTLDKIGCIPDFEQCGNFKTATEPLMRTGPSDESKKMTKWLLDGIYDDLLDLMAESRDVSKTKMGKLIDNGPYTAEQALAAGLIDSVQHRQDFVAGLKRRFGRSVEIVKDYGKSGAFDMPDDNIFAVFEFLMKIFNPSPKVYTEPSVAIVYVDGTILVGQAERSPFGPSSGAFSTTLRKALDKAAEDASVKAVVLRVDSPGGSALASEIILHATRRVAARKPLIVSMGNVAASGGYYVTCAAETIFADRSTITASIGVLGGKIVTTGMWDKLGVNWHSVQRGAMAGLLSSAAPFNDAERKKWKDFMNSTYDVFKGHVVKARGDKLAKPIDELAGGRVFTGAQALELGLVDKIGGLEEAVAYAGQRAGLGEFEVRVIPEPASFFDFFMGDKRDDEDTIGISSGTRLALLELPMMKEALPLIARMDPLRAKAMIQALTRIQLIHEEGVVTMMPMDLVIR